MNDEDFPLISDWPNCDYAVVGFLLQDELGRILCQLRDDFDHVAGAGHWTVFGGHHEPPETYQMTAQRELEEELGVQAKLEDFEPLLRMVPAGGLQAYHYYFTYKKPLRAQDLKLQEGAGFGFLHYAQTQSMPFMSSARMVLDYLATHKKIALK